MLRTSFSSLMEREFLAGDSKAAYIVTLRRMVDSNHRSFGCDPCRWRAFLARRQKDIQEDCFTDSWTFRAEDEYSPQADVASYSSPF